MFLDAVLLSFAASDLCDGAQRRKTGRTSLLRLPQCKLSEYRMFKLVVLMFPASKCSLRIALFTFVIIATYELLPLLMLFVSICYFRYILQTDNARANTGVVYFKNESVIFQSCPLECGVLDRLQIVGSFTSPRIDTSF